MQPLEPHSRRNYRFDINNRTKSTPLGRTQIGIVNSPPKQECTKIEKIQYVAKHHTCGEVFRQRKELEDKEWCENFTILYAGSGLTLLTFLHPACGITAACVFGAINVFKYCDRARLNLDDIYNTVGYDFYLRKLQVEFEEKNFQEFIRKDPILDDKRWVRSGQRANPNSPRRYPNRSGNTPTCLDLESDCRYA